VDHFRSMSTPCLQSVSTLSYSLRVHSKETYDGQHNAAEVSDPRERNVGLGKMPKEYENVAAVTQSEGHIAGLSI
jgi:hypothetical protein